MYFNKCIRQWVIIVVLLSSFIVHGQNLYVTNNNNLILTGSAYIELNNQALSGNTTFTNNYILKSSNTSTISIKSKSPAFIAGSPPGSLVTPYTFRNLNIDIDNGNSASPNVLTLNTNININGNLNFSSNGLLELNNKIITLGLAGAITNETNTARITGTNGGTVTQNITMGAGSTSNFGNMGITITTAGDLGIVTVSRGHVLQVNSGSGFGDVYRYYDIRSQKNPSSNNLIVQFNYFDAELIKVPVDFTNNKDQLTLWNSQESTRKLWLLTDRDAYDITNDWVSKSNIPTFATASGTSFRLTLGSTTVKPLPIVILSFNGKKDNDNNLLNWSISIDGSLHHFELEHSQDGTSFSKLSDILPGLTTNNVEDYSYTDQHPYNPITYYRLKVLDKTQKYSYSNVVKLKAGNEITASIYPNPAADHAYLTFSSITNGIASIELFNSAGQLVRNKTLSFNKGDNVFEISLAGLPKGMYVVRSVVLNLDHNMLIKN